MVLDTRGVEDELEGDVEDEARIVGGRIGGEEEVGTDEEKEGISIEERGKSEDEYEEKGNLVSWNTTFLLMKTSLVDKFNNLYPL